MKGISQFFVVPIIALSLIACDEQETPTKDAKFTTIEVTDVALDKATVKSSLSVGTQNVLDCGFVWGTIATPSIGAAQEEHFGPKDKDQDITHTIAGLESNTTYYLRTFLILNSGTVYSDVLSFTTGKHSEFKTLPATGISFTKAMLSGELLYHNEILDCGFVWSETSDPTTTGANKKYFGPQSSDNLISFEIVGLEMNKKYYFRTFIISSTGITYGEELSLTTLPEVQWEVPGGFPGRKRMGAVSFVIGNYAYVGLGHGRETDENDHLEFLSDFWQFDMVTNEWTQKKDFPGGGRSGAIGFSIKDRGYVGTGGSSGGATKDFWEYNPITDDWIQKADFLGGNIGWAVGFSIDNKGYVGTGAQNGGPPFLKTFYEYDPGANQWSRKADFPGLAVDQAVGFSIGEYGYIGLGLREESWLGAVTDLWAYSPANDTWTKKKNCPSATSMDGSVAFVLNNKAYVTGGWGGEKTVWVYNPETDDWDADGEMAGSYRIGAVAFVAGNKAIIGTGATVSTFFKDFVEYTSE